MPLNSAVFNYCVNDIIVLWWDNPFYNESCVLQKVLGPWPWLWFPIACGFSCSSRHFSFWSPCFLSGLCWSLRREDGKLSFLPLPWLEVSPGSWADLTTGSFQRSGHTPDELSNERMRLLMDIMNKAMLHSALRTHWFRHKIWMHSLLGKKKL